MCTPMASTSQIPQVEPAEQQANLQTVLVETASLGWRYLDTRLKDEDVLRSVYLAATLNEGGRSPLNRMDEWLAEGSEPTPKTMTIFRSSYLPHLIVDGFRKQRGLALHENASQLAMHKLDRPCSRPARIERVRYVP